MVILVMYIMKKQDVEIAKQHMDEILEYRAVLSYMLKRKITIEQAMADWIDKGYVNRYRKK